MGLVRNEIRGRGFSLILALVAAFMLMSTGVANAGHFTGACSTELNAVEAAIEAGDYSKAGNKANLMTKLTAADAKINLGKFEGAIDKLEDISGKATAWAGANKPKLDDAAAITAAVTNAITCVGGL